MTDDDPVRRAKAAAGSGGKRIVAARCGEGDGPEPARNSGLAGNAGVPQRPAMQDSPPPPRVSRAAPNHPLRLSPVQIDAVRTALAEEVSEWLEERDLATKPLDSMTEDERDEVCEAAYRALMNAAPIVRSYTARRHGERYPVWIAGIEGVYVLMGPEHDTPGPFSTLADAVDAMDRHYGPFLVGD